MGWCAGTLRDADQVVYRSDSGAGATHEPYRLPSDVQTKVWNPCLRCVIRVMVVEWDIFSIGWGQIGYMLTCSGWAFVITGAVLPGLQQLMKCNQLCMRAVL